MTSLNDSILDFKKAMAFIFRETTDWRERDFIEFLSEEVGKEWAMYEQVGKEWEQCMSKHCAIRQN